MTDWTTRGLCHTGKYDPELWHSKDRKELTLAKAVCDICPVRLLCLDFALETEQPWGLWGGLKPRERWRIVQRRRLVG